MRAGLVARIERETANHLDGLPAWIRIKVNSIVDEATIDALYRASQAGVPIDLLVRGICAVRPGVPGLSETIRVRSILGRFLEHARVFAFANAGDPEVLIGSADLMHRNLDRRVETLVTLGPDHSAELLDLLTLSMDDGTASWYLGADDTWTRHHLDDAGLPLRDLQEYLIARQRRHPARDR
jgi:polyphosphate kinase